MTITLSDLTPITHSLPPIGTTCLIYTVQGGFAVATFTDKIGTVGRYKEAWFRKGSRVVKRVVGWCEVKTK
jgi:hypothetical protein